MREIEFRGKRIRDDKWCFGSLAIWKSGKTDIAYEDNREGCIDFMIVDPNTVGQYTGLNDKNGVKIFEGDILEWGHYKRICQVKWLDDTARFLYITPHKSIIYPGEAKACVVIGNTYDNPELLED